MFRTVNKPINNYLTPILKGGRFFHKQPNHLQAQFTSLEQKLFANNKPVKCIAFDGGGTLSPFCFEPITSFQHAFEKKNINLTPAEIRRPTGISKDRHIEESWLEHFKQPIPPKVKHEIYQDYLANQRKLLRNTTPVPELANLFQELRKQNIGIALNTAYCREEALIFAEALKKYSIEFDFIVSNSDVKKGRPYPFMLHRIAEFFGINEPQELMVVGDTKADMHAAQYYYPRVGAAGYSSELNINSLEEAAALSASEMQQRQQVASENLKKYGANYCIIEPVQLLDVIKDFNHRIKTKNFNTQTYEYLNVNGEDGLRLRANI